MPNSNIYRDLLLRQGHGLPLWIPDPDRGTTRGINVGDLGLLTGDGGFDFLCNIHLPASDPVNQRFEMPEFFDHLPHPRNDKEIALFHSKGRCFVQGTGYNVTGTFGAEAAVMPGTSIEGKVSFAIDKKRAAMLFLPHGADREDTRLNRAYREYAKQYGMLWYHYLNGTAGREVGNNSLYLVTGCDKSSSWALAAGEVRSDRSIEFSLKVSGLQAVLPAAGTVDFSASWSNVNGMEGRCFPTRIEDVSANKNQCVFVRGLVIGINENLLTKWRSENKVSITEISFSSASLPAVGNIPKVGLAPTNTSQPLPPNNSANESGPGELLDQGKGVTQDSENISNAVVIVQNYPEYPKQVLSPGSYICDYILSSQPNINLVIVHDNDWIAVTSSDGEEIFASDGTDYERLTTRVLEKAQLITQGKWVC